MTDHPSRYYQIHKGETAWLLGNGPSVLYDGWSMGDLREAGGRVIGMNNSWRSRKENEHGPAHEGFNDSDYYCFVSNVYVEHLLAGWVRTGCAFIPDRQKWMMIDPRSRFKGRWCALRQHGGTSPTAFRSDVLLGFDANFAGYLALQIAAHMGFSRIMLVGYDASDDGGHFHDEEPLAGHAPRHVHRSWFGGVRDWMKARRGEVEILNCSPDSNVDVFPRISRKEALNLCAKEAAS